MKQIRLIFLCALCAFGVQSYSSAQAIYGPVKFMGDVSVGSWTNPVSGLSIGVTNGGAFSDGWHTNWYRLSGTNALGRIGLATTNLTWLCTGTNDTAVRLCWSRYDGLQRYTIERSYDLGSTWTNYQTATPNSTNYLDRGTNTWLVGDISSLFSLIPAPTVPWSSVAYTGDVSKGYVDLQDEMYSNAIVALAYARADSASNHAAFAQWSANSTNANNTDTLDGHHWADVPSIAGLVRADGTVPMSGNLDGGGFSLTNFSRLYLGSSGMYLFGTGIPEVLTWWDGVGMRSVWNQGNQGAGTGMDADTLDTHHWVDVPSTNNLAPTNWVTAQGYGTGNVSKAVADGLYDGSGAAVAASNGVKNWLAADGVYKSAITNLHGGLGISVQADEAPYEYGYRSLMISIDPFSYSFGTGNVQVAYVDQQDAGVSNGVKSWVAAQGYGTGNVSKAYVDQQDAAVSNWVHGAFYGQDNPQGYLNAAAAGLLYDPLGAAAAASNHAAYAVQSQHSTNADNATTFASRAASTFATNTVFAGSGTTGLVTSAAGDAGNYLKADGTWAAVVASGGLSNNAPDTGTLPGITASNMLTKTFFEVQQTTAQTLSAAYTPLTLDGELYDYGNNFNTSTYTYTTPSAGVYLFCGGFTHGGLGVLTSASVHTNGTQWQILSATISASFRSSRGAAMGYLPSGVAVTFTAYADSGASYTGLIYTSISGGRIQ